ncbi:peptide MFS transporter [Algivirga pacifica]|uniref:Peptide MFS transporter n=1 Tax=Algivirga pacifica TaxID=1162670 RepID=A0ABP9DDS2_9BACT
MSQQTSKQGHPKGLYLLFTVEMWERFSYYGMRAIFILYMIKALQFSNEDASNIYGTYTSLVYLTPLLGGYISDRFWGNRRSIFVGGILMAIGQFVMFLSASMFDNNEALIGGISMPILLMYIALGFIIFGNGFFKPNISSMVGSLYPRGDNRLDSAFTIFYMGINLGAFFAPLVTGFVGDTGNPGDFRWGFLAASVGMILGTIIFEMQKEKHLVTPEGLPVGNKPIQQPKGVKGQGGDGDQLTRVDYDRIAVIFILSIFVIAFWSAFEQAGASLTVFADKYTNRNLMGWEVPASYFQSLNPAFIMLFAPLFDFIWTKLGDKQPSSPLKMSIGLALLGIGYWVIAQGVDNVSETQKASMFWLTAMYLLHTTGELALSPVGLSVVNKLSPAKFTSLMMGVWFLSTVAGNKLAGVFSAYLPTAESGPKSIMGIYEITDLNSFFMLFVFVSGGAAIILFLLHRVLEKMMHGIK